MLETIFSWLLSAVGEGLQLFVNFFFGNGNDGGLLNFTLGDLYQNFPYFGTAYAILQACGLGLVLAIAAVNLFKVFLGSLSKAQDTPAQILVRAALATVLIYLGGYLLSAVVGIAKVPYDIFVGSDAITHHFGIPDSLLTDLSAAVGVGAAGLLVSLVLIIAIAWNLIKLLLECVERYLMVGVLVYTSPLIYPFLSSAATATVFQRWVGMFCGECALMSLSVLFTKLSISALSSTSGGNSVIAKLIMCLTMCKIAQRVDSYMQQLGIGVPTTGEGILGNALAVGYALKHAFGGAAQKASKGDALSGNNSTFGNLFRGKRAYNDAFAQGNSPADSRAARKAARDYAKTPAGDWGMNQFTPRNANAVATAKRSQESAAAWQEKVQRQSGPVGENGGGRTGQQDFQDNAKKMGMSAQQFARMNLETNGAGCALIGPDGDNKANFELSPEAKNAGLMTSFPFGDDKDGMLVGPDSAVAAHIQDNFDKTELTDFAPDTEFHDVNPASLSPENLGNMKAQQEDSTNAYQSTLANTLAHGSPVVAQEVLFNDRKNISGNDTLAQAALSNTFGENLRVGDQSGTAAASRLSNIRAETQPLYTDEAGNQWGGGRVVSGLCAVPGSSGRTYEDGTEVPKFKRLEIMDETAYKQMSSIQQAQMQQIPSKNGEIFYARAMDVDQTQGSVEDWSRAVQEGGGLQDIENPRFEQGRPVAQNIAASTRYEPRTDDSLPNTGRGTESSHTHETPSSGGETRTYERRSEDAGGAAGGERHTYETPSGGGEAHSYEPSARDAGAASGGSGGEPRTVTQNTIINQPPSYTPAQRIEVINDQSSGTPASGTPQTPSSPESAPRSEGRQRDDGSRNGGGGPKPEEQGKGKKPPRVGPLRDKRK